MPERPHEMIRTKRPGSTGQQRSWAAQLWRLIRANLYDLGLLLRESWLVLAAFLAVTLIGTLYLAFAYDPCGYDADPLSTCRLDPLEALYETLKLQTLQSGLPFPRERLLGQLLFFMIPLLGLALIFQGVLNFGRLLLDKGSRREAWQVALASAERDHVIVCGLGRVGMRSVQQLIDIGQSVVVIENNWASEFVQRAVNMGIPVIAGDAREAAALRNAGIQRAIAVITAINDDLLNIEIALVARTLRPNIRVVLRIFSDELDQNLERALGRNAAFSASALAAPTFAAAAVSREVDYVLPTTSAPLGLLHLPQTANTPLATAPEQVEQATGIRVLWHSGAYFSRPATLIGPLHALEQLRLQYPLPHMPPPTIPEHPTEQFDTVIVCGLGKVGYRVVRQLYAMHPRPRIVVVRTTDGRIDFPQRIAALDGVEFVIGDAREAHVLHLAGLERAFSVAALTSDDLLNLQISLAARRLRPELHVVLRVFSDALADRLVDMFGIRTAYSTSALASPTLAAAALLGDLSHGVQIGSDLYACRQVTIQSGDWLAERTIAQLQQTEKITVLELERGGQPILLPDSHVRLALMDVVHLLAPISVLRRIASYGSSA